jgi:hypothetical protein
MQDNPIASSSSSLPRSRVSRVDRPITPLHLSVLLGLSFGAVVWGASLIMGGQESYTDEYVLLLGFFGIASASFIFSRIKENRLRAFDIPVFSTILVFVEFGLAPLECFLNPLQLNQKLQGDHGILLRALLYVILGMFAFWAGCSILRLRKARVGGTQEVIRSREHNATKATVWASAIGIYSLVFVTRIYLLYSHLYSYVGSWQAYYTNLSSLQVLAVVSSLGGSAALILVTIDKYFHPADRGRRLSFWAIFASQCLWGLAAGMKSEALQGLVIVAVVSSLIEGKFKKGWVAAAVLGLVIIYPLTNNYRGLVQERGGLSSVEGVASTGAQALSETEAQQRQLGSANWLQSGWNASVNRLDLLQSVALVLSLGPRATFLQGDERWWMIPFYPFIPRFIWHSKPILDKGARFSVALGYGDKTSTGITYPGDLYLSYGLAGLLAGMFMLGVVGQWLTDGITGGLDERRLFMYVGIFLTVTDMEIDAFSFWSGFIKSFVILSVIAWLVYGPRRQRSRVSAARGTALRES